MYIYRARSIKSVRESLFKEGGKEDLRNLRQRGIKPPIIEEDKTKYYVEGAEINRTNLQISRRKHNTKNTIQERRRREKKKKKKK